MDVPLDQDDEHAHYDPGQVDEYFGAATQAALILAAYRAPFRGRSTPVNVWWGSFDLAVSLFSGLPARPPSDDFIMRNAMDAQEVAVGWWPGDTGTARPRSMPTRSRRRRLRPGGPRPRRRALGQRPGEYVLEWDDLRSAPDPHAAGLEFARLAFRHACSVCGWDMSLADSADGNASP